MGGLHALHKILIEHAHPRPASVSPGEFLEVEPDLFAVSVHYNGQDADRLKDDLHELCIEELPLKERIFAFLDHGAPAPSPAFAAGQKRWRDLLRSYGIASTDGGAGIAHIIIPERGLIGPGEVVALKDSHTPTMGAVGAFAASPAGGVLSLFAIGRFVIDVPAVSAVRLEGTLKPGVFGRDVSLHVNGTLGQRGIFDKAVEFAGSYVRGLSMDMRFTLCSMSTEMGAMAAYVQPDRITLDWLAERATRQFKVFETDRDFKYEEVHDFDLSTLEPQIALPHAPDNVQPIGCVEGRHIDQAYLGSCASGRLEDIAMAARIMKGRKVHPDTRFVVTPGSREVLNAAVKLGYIEALNEANVIVTNASCGACPGVQGGLLAPGEVAISCNTRNFNGRMGPGAEIYLASPAAVAASAIEGRIANPAKYL